MAAARRGGISFGQWNFGRCDAVLCAWAAATANTELGGYAVFAVLDVSTAIAEVIATLGCVSIFT